MAERVNRLWRIWESDRDACIGGSQGWQRGLVLGPKEKVKEFITKKYPGAEPVEIDFIDLTET